MCRLRIPNGILSHWQFAGVADLAERYGGGYAHVTTRANLQIRDVMPDGAVALIEGLTSLGLTTKGTGADNIRNVTGSPTAGIDPQELIDTRPFASAWHHHILNDRSLYGLPRKFNVGFDGGGVIPVLEDTNDIAFTAVTVREGAGVDAGVWFRLGIGGITGHEDFAKYGNVYVKPDEAVAVADAIVRVFIDHGDRTDRKKARLKYVLDAWGHDKFLAEVEAKLGRKLVRLAADKVSAPEPPGSQGARRHSRAAPAGQGVGRRGAAGRQDDGRADARPRQDRPRAGRRRYPADRLAEPADLRHRRGERRAGRDLPARDRPHLQGDERARRAHRLHRQHGLQVRARPTPRTRRWRSPTGSSRASRSTPRSTFISPAARTPARSTTSATSACWRAACRSMRPGEDTVEGFHIYVGGGFGPDAGIARELYRDVKVEDCPQVVERILKAYRGWPVQRERDVSRVHPPS